MERFAAMVSARRAAPAPKHAPAVLEERKEEEMDEGYLRIQLEEIVIVKDDSYDALAAATAAARANGNGNGKYSSIHATASASTSATASAFASTSATASASVEKCGKATAAARGGCSVKAPAAQGAWTTVARIVGFD